MCAVCQREGWAHDHPKAPLQPVEIIGVPFVKLAMDFLSPVNYPSMSGKRFLLNTFDYLSKHIKYIPLRSVTSVSVVKALLNHASNFGFPQTLISDQAAPFMAEMIQQLF